MSGAATKALVVEGGGMRGVFAAGVLNSFGRASYDPFDLYLGVSAGACNLASHLAGQLDRNHNIYLTYSSSKRFFSFARFLRFGHFMDLDWLWEITIKECRLDLDALFGKLDHEKKELVIVCTETETGRPLYLQPDASTLEHYLKVSSALPLLYRNVLYVQGKRAVDGGIADSIPVAEALRRGAKEVTVIRSRPSGRVRRKSRLAFLYPLMFPRALAKTLAQRPAAYEASLRLLEKPPPGVRISEIAPPSGFSFGRTTQDRLVLQQAYVLGQQAGRAHVSELG